MAQESSPRQSPANPLFLPFFSLFFLSRFSVVTSLQFHRNPRGPIRPSISATRALATRFLQDFFLPLPLFVSGSVAASLITGGEEGF